MFIKYNKTKIYGVAISVIAALVFEACSPTAQSGYGPSSKSGNNESSTGDSGVSLPSDLSQVAQFFVALDTKTTYPNYTSQMSTLGVPQYGTKCAVDKSSSSHKNITCVIEAPELSLWYGGIQMAVNVPSGMCEYLREVPYWYYNKETGYGPTSVAMEITNRENVGTSYRCSVNGSSLSSTCSGFTEAFFKTDGAGGITEKCIYDNSSITNGKNCCFGNYSLTTTTINIDASGTSTSTTAYDIKSWGGNLPDCIGGQGKTNWDAASVDGYPIEKITEIRSGILKPIIVDAPAKSIHGYPSVIPVANYYTTSSTVISSLHYHTGYGSASGTSSAMPYYVNPISDRDGTAMFSAKPAYEYHCLDDAFEIKHKIKLYVRQWDVYAPFATYISTGAYTGTAPWDYSGTEGSSCDGVTDPDEPCNDFLGSDDIPRGLGGSYNVSTSSTALRYYFFPNHDY